MVFNQWMMIEAFDLRTFIFAILIAQAGTTLTLFVMFSYAKNEAAIPYWILHKSLLLIGIVSLYFRPLLNQELSIFITNLCIMSGYAFMVMGACKFMHRKTRTLYWLAPVFVMMIPISYYTFIDLSVLHRVFLSGVLYVTYSVIAGYLYFVPSDKYRPNRAQKWVSIALFVNAITWGHNILVIPLDMGHLNYFDDAMSLIKIDWISTFFVDVMATMGFVVMVYERMANLNQRVTSELQELVEEQRQFMLMLSHEFKNPLATIKRSTEFVEDALKPVPEDIQLRFSNIKDRVGLLFGLVESFLKHETERHTYDRSAFEQVTLTQLQDEVMGYMSAEDRARIQSTCDDGSIKLDCNVDLVTSAISTIVDNALKFSAKDKRVEITCSQQSDRVEIQVRDEGIGIEPDEISKITQRFYRAKNALGYSGNGLGLSMAKWVVELHGGELKIDSQPQQGSTISLIFPIK